MRLLRIIRATIGGAALCFLAGLMARAEVKVSMDHNAEGAPEFKFENVPQPVKHDAADRTNAQFTIVDGERDPNGGNLRVLNDGRLPEDADDPGNNFFFAAGSDGGRLTVDLHNTIAVKQVNTYSWHPATRAPQVYNLYASDGAGANFNAEPKRGTDPAECGWKLLAKVDTRAKFGVAGGQYGVSVSDDSGVLGQFRYFLFDIIKTEDTDAFGQTFFSEIDVRAVTPSETETPAGWENKTREKDFDWTLDVSRSPDLKDWAETKLKPAVDQWYPVWEDCLASDGFSAPKKFTITIKPMRGVAATSGTDVVVSESWIKGQIAKPDWNEAIGSVIHELAHVVQQYKTRGNPGWLVEGIADYLRWFQYEPPEHRPKLSARRAARAKYSDSYKTTAGFLEYIAKNHDHEFVVRMNAALRQGRYSPNLWKEFTGMTVQELWREYVQSLPQETAGAPAATHTFAIGTNDFLLDGHRLQIRCGEIHAARVPKEYWTQRLRMAKAMGLNTVCAYLFWNLHEPEPGKFVWSGQADMADFCRVAQQEGLWVVLRPGPYACAEWEMGGLPWWLLRDENIPLRTRDPRFLAAMKSYLHEVGRVLGPLQITHGGPILMAQVENEYGSFGHDAGYMDEVRKALLEAGFDVPLFACNPPSDMKNGLLTNLFQAANFGGEPEKNFAVLRRLQPSGPLFCSEFYPGWFDTWGQPHHYGKMDSYLADLEYMLSHDASFSIYMAHGGTTFGLWSGCDQPFKPDTSSYDYDAPISEAGWATPKFSRTRELFAKYLLPGEKLPDPPAPNPVVSFPPVELKESAPLFENLPPAVKDGEPHPMETYGQGYGCILYRTSLPAGPAATLQAKAIHDFGFVFLDGKPAGVLDRRGTNVLLLPARAQGARLDILVEPMGRINFGPKMADHKGLIAPVTLGEKVLHDWEIFNLPLNDRMLAGLKFQPPAPNGPAFWRGSFNLEKPGDTFLDLRRWGKGDLWVNGRCLGRYWNIGPTQTAYAPGCWLRSGENEVVILDFLGPSQPAVAGLEKPILDERHPEKDFTRNGAAN